MFWSLDFLHKLKVLYIWIFSKKLIKPKKCEYNVEKGFLVGIHTKKSERFHEICYVFY